jgi:hypothetical protein
VQVYLSRDWLGFRRLRLGGRGYTQHELRAGWLLLIWRETQKGRPTPQGSGGQLARC